VALLDVENLSKSERGYSDVHEQKIQASP